MATTWQSFCRGVLAVLVVSSPAVLVSGAPAALSSSGSNCMKEWLLSLGFNSENVSSYNSLFYQEAVSEQALHLFTLQDLQSLGVAKLGHRVLIHNTLEEGAVLCKNGGQCNPVKAENSSFLCECLDGFGGNHCETVTSCSAHVCLNGGTCVELTGGEVKCNCPTGYSGDRCEQDPCYLEPCENGGSCSSINGSYNCSCQLGYSGSHCETAWLTQEDYDAFKTQMTTKVLLFQSFSKHLSDSLNTMKQDIEQARLIDKEPRFFSHWDTLEQNNEILHMETFSDSNTDYFSILYSNHSINTYSFSSSGDHSFLQELAIANAASFVLFEMDSTFYLAVAKNSTANSEIYKWRNGSFIFLSRLSTVLSTRGARNVEFVSTPRQGNYLVFACYHQTFRHNFPAFVYKWASGEFHFYQYLWTVTRGLTVDSVVTSDGDVLLVLTHEVGNGDTSTVMYRWNGTYFDDRTNHSQDISAFALGTKMFPLTIGQETFLLGRSILDSSLAHFFRYDRHSRQFIKFTDIDTPNTIAAAEYFHMEAEHFLILSNFQESPPAVPSSSQYNVLVYRLLGAGFQLFQEIEISFRPSILCHFSIDECQGIAIASSNGNIELYQWLDSSNRCL